MLLYPKKKTCGTPNKKTCGKSSFAAAIFGLPFGAKSCGMDVKTDEKLAAGPNLGKKLAAD